MLTKATWWCGGIFLVLALVLSLVPRGGGSSALQERLRAATPARRRPSAPLPLGGTPTPRRAGTGDRAVDGAVAGARRPARHPRRAERRRPRPTQPKK